MVVFLLGKNTAATLKKHPPISGSNLLYLFFISLLNLIPLFFNLFPTYFLLIRIRLSSYINPCISGKTGKEKERRRNSLYIFCDLTRSHKNAQRMRNGEKEKERKRRKGMMGVIEKLGT